MRKVLIVLLLALPLCLAGAESFYVEDYNIVIDVDEAKKLSVKETLGVCFTSPSHGIIRDIQYDFGSVQAEVGNISSSSPMTVSRSGGMVSVRLGDNDTLVSGGQAYFLSYDYSLPADSYPGYDELYYNIVAGAGWSCDMSSVRFSVTFPYPLDEERIWVTAGPYGSERTLPFSLSDDGLTVSGAYRDLPAGYSLTLRAEMEDGYFNLARKDFRWEQAAVTASFALCFLILLFLVFLYLRYGREEAVIAPARFSPPEGLSPMDTAYLYRQSVCVDQVSAMLIYWADKGLLNIREEGSSYSFERLGEPRGNAGETALFSAFFGDGRTADEKTLRDRDFPGLLGGKVQRSEASVFSASKALWSEESLKAAGMGRKALALCFALFSLVMVISLRSALALFFVVPAFMAWKAFSVKTPLPVSLFLIVFLFVFMLTASSAQSLTVFPSAAAYLMTQFLGGRLVPAIRKRSAYAQKRMEEAEGYKEFIDKVEKDRIKALSDEDPGFFYKVLPYAMVFGLADKWCDKFKSLYVRPARWYRSRSPWDIYMLSRFGRGFRNRYHGFIAPERQSGGRSTRRGYSGHAGGGFSGGGGRSW